MKIVCDIGGTFARFGLVQNGMVEKICKYKAAGFADFQTALGQYARDQGIETKTPLRIATAAYADENGAWRFVNNNPWIIEPQKIKAEGWDIEVILNDFEAATWALCNLKDVDINVLKAGRAQNDTKCLLGPGTGLGLGYLHGGAVQKTHGGHMPAAAVSEEQWQAVQDIYKGVPVVFEDLVSGPALQELRARYDDKKALRLFHEFFGVFAANAVITGHAYGGLYLTGGVLENLIAESAFDFATFEKWFCIRGVASVQNALEHTPIIHITYPYPALKGLLNA